MPTKTVADSFLARAADDPPLRSALLVCASALCLDDDIAAQAIHLVVGTNGSTTDVLQRLKRLGCVHEQWDGSWYLAHDVRADLVKHLDAEVPEDKVRALRELVAQYADSKAGQFAADGQLTAYRKRAAQFESAYQRCLQPERVAEGARQFEAIWEEARGSGERATVRAVDYLAPEIDNCAGGLPAPIRFFQGMAAYRRGDRKSATRMFEVLWREGRPGKIYAIAAHLYGQYERNREIAEQALNDSIAWLQEDHHQGQVYHSLGNLLARDRNRWAEAEDAYHASIGLLRNAADQGQVYHSLGNLLAQDRHRLAEAEKAYRASLDLLQNAFDQGQVYHSLGNLLARDRDRWDEAEKAYRTSLDLLHHAPDRTQVYASWAEAILRSEGNKDLGTAERYAQKVLDLSPKDPKSVAVAHKIFAEIHERRCEWPQAIEAVETMMETDQRARITRYRTKNEQWLAELRRKAAATPANPSEDADNASPGK